MYVLSKSVAVNDNLLLHLRFLGICVFFFMYTVIILIICPSTKVAVNGHPYKNFRFFFYVCFFLHVHTHFFKKKFLQQGCSLTGWDCCK